MINTQPKVFATEYKNTQSSYFISKVHPMRADVKCLWQLVSSLLCFGLLVVTADVKICGPAYNMLSLDFMLKTTCTFVTVLCFQNVCQFVMLVLGLT